MMISRFLAYCLLIIFSNTLWSFSCFYTLAKDSCWTNYNVSVDVIDMATSKILFTINVPAGQSWARQEFACTPAQGLIYKASFSPVFWRSDEGKVYPALRSWSLPGKVNPGELAWTIPICFPADFSQVPFPPDAKGNCACDFDNIPAPKPD